MKHPSLTVLMTVYDGGELLKQSIKSVLNQSYSDFEFLIINDKSIDDSAATIQSFDDERIVLHNNEHNIGQSHSLNVGLEMAKGDYVARIDADDVALPNWLEKQMKCLKAHPDTAVISPGVAVIDGGNKVRKKYCLPKHKDHLILRSFIRSPINHVGSIIHRETALSFGGYDAQYRVAADFDLWGKILRNQKKIVTMPDILLAIREHSQSLSKAKNIESDIAEFSKIMQKNINHFTQISFTEDQIKLLAGAFYSFKDMSIAQFEQAINIFLEIVQNLKPVIQLSQKRVLRWFLKSTHTVYVRKIFVEIEKKNYTDVRTLSFAAIQRFGWLSIFSTFIFLSLFRGILLNALPKVYKKSTRDVSRYTLKDKLKSINIG